MTATARRSLVVIGAAVVATAVCSVGPESVGANVDPSVAPLDGFTLRHLPDGLGPMVSDFDYEWDDVSFRTRVWERGPDAESGYRVDLMAAVLRSERLANPHALRDFLADYLEHDPLQWPLHRYDRNSYHGFATSERVFFLFRPGVAVQVSADEGSVVKPDELIAIADGIEPADT